MTQFAGPGLIKIIDASGNPIGLSGTGPVIVRYGDGSGLVPTVFEGERGAQNALPASASQMAWNNTAGQWERIRTPGADLNGFHTGQATAAGVTSLWTPQAGKRIRLLRLRVGITGNASLAVAGVEVISLRDGAATVLTNFVNVFLPAAAGAGGPNTNYETPWTDFGPDGYQSQAANNSLGLTLGTALATGNAYAVFVGVEE